jgi:hypothetical protein
LRASTIFGVVNAGKIVDGRDKPGHDDGEVAPYGAREAALMLESLRSKRLEA